MCFVHGLNKAILGKIFDTRLNKYNWNLLLLKGQIVILLASFIKSFSLKSVKALGQVN